MPLAFLFDQHVQKSAANGLRPRGVDVLTAFEDGSNELPDPELLDRATALGRALVTQDTDFLVIAAERAASNTPFVGIVFAAQLEVSVGDLVRDLESISHAVALEEMRDQLVYLPL